MASDAVKTFARRQGGATAIAAALLVYAGVEARQPAAQGVSDVSAIRDDISKLRLDFATENGARTERDKARGEQVDDILVTLRLAVNGNAENTIKLASMEGAMREVQRRLDKLESGN